MKRIGRIVAAVLLIGAFTYVAIADVPVETTQVSKTISNERFFDAD